MITNPGRRAFVKKSLSMLTTLALSGCGGGGSGSDTKAPAAAAPSIILHPANQQVLVGEGATFEVLADGTQPLSYQWQRDGVAIPGATASSYTTPLTASRDNAVFSVMVSNSAGIATSLDAQLVVSAPPSILVQPSDQSIIEGKSAFFQVVADGSLPLTYQWQRNGVDIADAMGPSYTTMLLSTGDDAIFSVRIVNGAGTILSRGALLTISPVSITADSTTITTDSLLVTADRL